MHTDGPVLTQNDPAAVERLHRSQVVELNSAIVLRLDDRLLERLTGRAADVECPHRQLRSRLDYRLRSDDADCFAKLHKLTRGKIAAIAHRANAATTLARKHRANLQALYPNSLKLRRDFLIDELVCLNDFLPLLDRVCDRLTTDATNNALAKIDNLLIALINRAHHNSVYRAAIFFVDDDVLRRVHKFAGKITRVRGFERRVREALTRSVRGNEVLEHGKPLTEV